MNPRALTGLAWLAILIPSQGCGPFFPDSVLDQPQAALAVPPVSYLDELYRITGESKPAGTADARSSEHPFLRQIPLETAELRDFWQKSGVEPAEIERRLRHYESVRQTLLAPIQEAGLRDFPIQDLQPPSLPAKPLGTEFPADIADYVEAARLHAVGKTPEARALWKSILERPPAERRLRAAWAAWMLAKTSPDQAECLDWYVRVETEIQSGATDVLDLGKAAKGWRGGLTKDPIAAIHLYLESGMNAAVDIRRCSAQILDSGNADTFRAAAADPLVRRLVNLTLHASLDGPHEFAIDPAQNAKTMPPGEWLSALEAQAQLPLDDGARVAWALYASGRFDESRQWLDRSVKSDPMTQWLQAKFDLRDGNLDAAKQHLAQALNQRINEDGWHPDNPDLDQHWLDQSPERQQANQGRLLADVGIVALARGEYLPALESLRKSGFREDAAYLAEAVISTDGLIKHVRKVAPRWSAPPKEEGPIDPFTCLTTGHDNAYYNIGTDNELRYLLARRLAREKRLKEAREFMPPELLPLLDHYIALDRARRTGRYSGEAQAAVIWRQALIHRHLGAELFSTDGAPDGGARGWNFTGIEFTTMRSLQKGWTRENVYYGPIIEAKDPSDHAIPPVTSDEVRRVKRYALPANKRFHYRYVAAELAWEAANSLPRNHPLLPGIYNTAGQWLAVGDPAAADRFYQAMIRRCGGTPEGMNADTKRWFLADLKPQGDLPGLPAEFKTENSRVTP